MQPLAVYFLKLDNPNLQSSNTNLGQILLIIQENILF